MLHKTHFNAHSHNIRTRTPSTAVTLAVIAETEAEAAKALEEALVDESEDLKNGYNNG